MKVFWRDSNIRNDSGANRKPNPEPERPHLRRSDLGALDPKEGGGGGRPFQTLRGQTGHGRLDPRRQGPYVLDSLGSDPGSCKPRGFKSRGFRTHGKQTLEGRTQEDQTL